MTLKNQRNYFLYQGTIKTGHVDISAIFLVTLPSALFLEIPPKPTLPKTIRSTRSSSTNLITL